jgi:hypothetical protein
MSDQYDAYHTLIDEFTMEDAMRMTNLPPQSLL